MKVESRIMRLVRGIDRKINITEWSTACRGHRSMQETELHMTLPTQDTDLLALGKNRVTTGDGCSPLFPKKPHTYTVTGSIDLGNSILSQPGHPFDGAADGFGEGLVGDSEIMA
jgi:hypothetical protein